MDLSVIENDPKEVKKYLQNFVPINYYKVLDDAYLYQIRAVLLHSVSHAELYNPVYAGLINDLTVTSGKNYATINTKIEGIVDNFSALATKTETLEVEAANANASIIEIQQARAEQNKAQASVNQRLEASLDDIVVGGRNIMKNSDFSKGYRAWQEASITKHNHFIGTMHKISSTGIVGSLMGIYPLAKYQNMAMVEGTEYSISFYAYGSILLMDEIYLTSASEAPIKLPSVVISTDLSERRHITFKAPTGGGGLGLIFGATATSEDDWFSISRIKVELGNKPSDWTPAPEDVEGYINEVQSSIDTFKDVQVERNLATAQTIEKMDTRVKGNAASILEEKNTRVDQFSALSQVNTELVSKTNENEAAIKTVDKTFTDRYNANVSRLGVLEADNSLGKGKIENLESVTTSLGEVVVSQSSTLNAKINNLTMGGRNLLRNSDFKLGVDTWGTSVISYAKSIVGNLTTVTNTGTTTDYFGLTPVNVFKTVTLIKDKEYVLSFYAKGNIPSINDIWITTEGELPQQLDSVAITDGIGDRYSIVFTANHTTEVGSIIIGASGYAKGKWFAVAAVKLEIGNKATDWTEAPEDTKAFIHDVEANINDFKEVQVNYNEAKALQLLELTTKTDNNIAELTELRETTSNIEGSTAALETKLRGEYTSSISTTKSDITKETDGKIDAVKVTLSEMSTDISSKADITRVDSVENNAKQSLATARTELTSSYTSAISTAKTESATDATNKANKAKTDANTYTDGKVTTLTKLVNSKADISRVDEVENNAVKSLASTKSVITSEYTSAISTSKEESASDAQIKADKALADANSVTATKASEAQEAAEVYALAKAKAEADAALALAKGDATSKSDAAKSAAIAAAALDAKNKADKALADAKLDATAKAEAAKLYAKGLVDTLTTVVNSKADITRVDKVVNDSTQALAQAKTDIKGAYTLAITESSKLSATDAQTKANKALADATIKATQAQTAAETYALAQANAKAAAALDSAKSDATTKANKAKADAELAAALDAKNKADEALRLAKLDATAKADAVKDMVVSLTKVVDSKASISRVDDIENNATQALATAKTELTSNYTTAITTAKNQSATDAKTKADAALAAAKIDAQNKANAAKTAAETYALAEAKAKADAALVLAKSDATTKANAAKSAAEATAALDAKNKADKALADAKIDATAKANAAKTYADGIVKTLKTEVDSKATINQLNTVKNDATQALATAKTELTSSFKSSIESIEIGGRNTLRDSNNFNIGGAYLGARISVTESYKVPEWSCLDATLLTITGGTHTLKTTPAIPTEVDTLYSVSFWVKNIGLSPVRINLNGFTISYSNRSLTIEPGFSGRLCISGLSRSAPYPNFQFQLWSTEVTDTVKVVLWRMMLEKGNKISDWTPAPEDVTDYVDTSVSTLKTLVDTKASISRVDTVENNATKALATAKTELTGSYTTAIATAKSQSATDAQTRATKALTDAKADTVLKANAAETAAKTYALAEAKAKADAALVTAKSDATTKSNAAESAAKVAAALDAKQKADKALADAKIDSKAKADEAERLAKAHADTKVTALTKIVDSKASITSVEKVVNDANQALATAKTELTSSYTEAIKGIEIGSRNLLKDSALIHFKGSDNGGNGGASVVVGDFVRLTPVAAGNVWGNSAANGGLVTASELLVGEQYTYSVLVKTAMTSIGLYCYSGGNHIKSSIPLKSGNVWERVSFTFTQSTARAKNYTFLAGFHQLQAGVIVEYRNFKLEKGNRVTDWTPAPEDVEASIATETKARSDADTALGSRITTLDTDYKGNKTAIRSELTAVSNKTNSTATSLGTLTTTVGGNTTKISQETTARSTADTALGKRITDTDAIAKNAQSRVGTAETAISNASSAIATLRTDLTASYSVADTRSTNQTPTWYQTNHPRQVVREFKTATAIGLTGGYAYLETTIKYSDASGGRVSQEASIDSGSVFIRTGIGTGTAWSAWVEQEDVTGSAAKVAAAKLALDTRINTTDARVTAEKKVAADATSAVAKTVGTLTTTVNGHTSTINETKTSLNGISAKWSMETNVNGKVSGIYQHSTGKSSGLDIITDKFTLSNGTNAGYAPFRQEGNTTYLNMAVIKDASITSAKIENLAVTTAKIAKGAITSAQIEDAAITSAKIGFAEIDTLRIKDGAVTVPRIETIEVVSITGTERIIHTIPMDAQGGKVAIKYSAEEINSLKKSGIGGGSHRVYINIYRGLELLRSVMLKPNSADSGTSGINYSYAFLASIIDEPPLGEHIYYVKVFSRNDTVGSSSISYSCFEVTGIKK